MSELEKMTLLELRNLAKEQNIRKAKCIFSYKLKVVGRRDDTLLSNLINIRTSSR